VSYILRDGPPPVDTDVKDGVLATQAHLGKPMGVWVDESGKIYIADTKHHRIRMVDTNGIISTIAGKGVFAVNAGQLSHWILSHSGSYSGDGKKATEAYLDSPVDLCLNEHQNLYFADTGNHRIRKIDLKTNVITTVAGDGFKSRVSIDIGVPLLWIGRFAGDGKSATQASFNFPMSVCVSPSGDIFISDTHNHRIRILLSQYNIIETIAGVTHRGTGGNIPPYPIEIFRDFYTYFFRSPWEVGGFSGDNGPALQARFDTPTGIFMDQKGDLYIADTGNNRIRKIENIETAIYAATGTTTAQKADFNSDQQIDFFDFLLFVAHFDTQAGDGKFDSKFDLNADGNIGFQDFLGFAARFGKSVFE
jgi:DNA-binding beta-propeller fold protein YncE